MRWNHDKFPEEAIKQLSTTLEISPYLATLLLRLNISDPEKAQRFLYPRLGHLTDPFNLTNMEEAVNRLHQAIEGREEVLIIGDYDVDGVTSTTLLVSFLKKLKLEAKYQIPHRVDDGYGLTLSVINRALSYVKPALLIALDCGTNSHEEVKYLFERGIDVIIIDHHMSKKSVEAMDAILVNPHVFDSKESPWLNLCTVGLVFKFIHALLKKYKDEEINHPDTLKLSSFLDLVALGTIADLVSLTDENRILTYYGLQYIQRGGRPGVQALCDVSGISNNQEVKPSDVAFRLGPRINASGRLADAHYPVKMLLENDLLKCSKVARKLDEMNKERQDIERQITEEAHNLITTHGFDKDMGIVLYGEDWHPGVLGIVAGRLSRDFHRPVIILGKESEFAKGSGRSIPGVDLVEALGLCQEYLETWGGHPMAAGVSLNNKWIDRFHHHFIKAISEQLGEKLPEPSLEIATWLPVDALNNGLLDELQLLHPFGNGNPEPIFGIKGVYLMGPPKLFGDSHFRFQLETAHGTYLNGVAWRLAHRLPPEDEALDLAIRFSWNHWNGRKTPQMQLIDWRFSKIAV